MVFFNFQNIKKLLKIPYSKSHVSMAVHRVGRTLLLDDLDIQELFMKSSQVQQGLVYNFLNSYQNQNTFIRPTEGTFAFVTAKRAKDSLTLTKKHAFKLRKITQFRKINIL